MELPLILFSNATGFDGSGILLCTKKPFNVGKVIKHDTDEKMNAYISKWRLENRCGIIPGYNIIIIWIGVLGNIFDGTPFGDNVTMETQAEILKMAEFYEREYVKKSERKYQKYIRK